MEKEEIVAAPPLAGKIQKSKSCALYLQKVK